MKTLKQIEYKILYLKKKLQNKTIVENFGKKEIQNLDNYVGDVYLYNYLSRLKIINIINSFNSWCMNYTGK